MRTPSRPSVAHLLWAAHAGGIERLVIDLATAQMERGDAVRVVFGQAQGPFADLAARRGLTIVDLQFRSGYEASPRMLTRAARALHGSDLVHLHSFNLPLAIAAARSGRPIVYTEHGFTALNGAAVSARVKGRLKRQFLRRRVRAIAANSHFTAERLAAAGMVSPTAIRVVHNGIDVRRLAQAEPGLSDHDGLIVACVSRLVRWKRVHLMLEGLARVADDRTRAIVIGDGPERARLEQRAIDLGCEERVNFLGFREDVHALLASADVLVHPSFDEWFGLAVLESAAQGLLPVVFSDGGGVLEVLPPDGEIVDNVAALASVLDRLPGSERVSLGARRARSQWVRKEFPIERCAERYSELYGAVNRT